jgi:hypothetical protein
MLLEKQHQENLEEIREHYEYMKKSTTEREIKEVNMKNVGEKINLEA